MNRREIMIFLLLLALALVLRISLVPLPGYSHDIDMFKVWSQAAAEKGVSNIYDQTTYPPGYLYVLKYVGSIYKVFSPVFDKGTYLLQFLIKFPPILVDLIISAIVFIYVRRKHPFITSILAMSAFAFNPAIIFNSAWWGQSDSIPSLFVLCAVIALASNKFSWAWAIITAGVLTKLQSVALVPVLILITWKRAGIRGIFNSISAAWCAAIILLLPFFWSHKIINILNAMFGSVGEFPYISMNAYNLWWLVTAGQARWMSDTSLILNIISYRAAGLVMLGIFLSFLLLYLFKNEKDENALFFCSFLAVFSLFMLTTEMHERYVLMSLTFLLIAAVNNRALKWIYGILTMTTFFSLLFVLFQTYPGTFPAAPAFWRSLPIGMVISMINVILLLYLIYMIIKNIQVKYSGYILSAAMILIAGLSVQNLVRPVYLSDMVPRSQQQQWGKLQKNRSVDGRTLNINGYIYSNGLGTHAFSSIEYEINGRYHYLDGAVGLDDEATKNNLIEAWIYADGRQIYNSGKFGGWEDPHYFRLKIAGVKVLKFVITDGGDGITRDHGDWLRIRVLP